MTRPRPTVKEAVKEADGITEALQRIGEVVAPSRYETTTPSKYAVAAPSKYAVAAPSRYVQAAERAAAYAGARAATGRYAGGEPSRYDRAKLGRLGRFGTVQRPKRTVVVVESGRTVDKPSGHGTLLWMPSYEYERCWAFDYVEWGNPWYVGDVVDLTEAAVAQHQMWLEDGNPEEDFVGNGLLCAYEAVLEDTFDPDTEWWTEHESPLWPEVMDRAREMRARLVGDLDLTLECAEDLRWIAKLNSRRKPVTREEVEVGLQQSTRYGLGAAAVDAVTWTHHHLLGEKANELAELIMEMEQEEYVNFHPIENFIFLPDDLHPGSHRFPARVPYYELFGEYLLIESEYRSDECDSIPYGWMSDFMAPYGQAQLPPWLADGMKKEPPDPGQLSMFDR